MNSSDIGPLIQSTLALYKSAAIEATRGLVKNPILILGSLVGAILWVLAIPPLGHLGMAGGLLAGILWIVLVSYILGWTASIVNKDKLDPRTMAEFDNSTFSAVISVAFIFFLVQYILGSLLRGLPGEVEVMTCVALGILLVLNCVPEVVSIHRFQSLHALSHSAKFSCDNWIEWFTPLAIIVLTCIALTGGGLLSVLAFDPLLPAKFFVLQIPLLLMSSGVGHSLAGFGYLGLILLAIPGIIIGNWFMLFRGFLFLGLESGTRRRRIHNWRQS